MVRKNPQGMQPIKPTHEAVFRVCGESILFQTNSNLLIEIAANALDCLGSEGLARPPGLRIQLFVLVAGSQEGNGIPDEATMPAFRMQEHLFTMVLDKENNAVVDLLDGFASGCLTEDIVRDRQDICRDMIRTMALPMLPIARNMIPIHASCVVRDGRGVILSGESGVGKSTLAMACIQQGFQLLADDAVFLRRDPAGLRLAGLPCEVRLFANSFALLSSLPSRGTLRFANNKWKHNIDPGQLFPGSKIDLALPGVVILLDRSADPTKSVVRHLTKPELEEGIEVAWPYHLDWSEAAQANLDELLQLPGYQMSLGQDLTRTVHMLDQLLAEHFPSTS